MKNSIKEPLWLMREVYRAYKAEMAAVARFTYGQILFERTLPTLSDLFATVSLAEMRHYHALGELLRDLGVSHALKTTLQDFSYRCGGNLTDHEAAARHFLGECIKEEQSAALHYARLAERFSIESARSLLSAMARDEEDHAAALQSALQRLMAS